MKQNQLNFYKAPQFSQLLVVLTYSVAGSREQPLLGLILIHFPTVPGKIGQVTGWHPIQLGIGVVGKSCIRPWSLRDWNSRLYCVVTKNPFKIFTTRKSLRRLCFYTCVSVHGEGVPGQVPPGRYTPPRVGTFLSGRYTPREGTPPLWAGTASHPHPTAEQCMLGDTGNKRAVRTLLECILVRSILDDEEADIEHLAPQ